ncbi:MAG: hypothetical protein NTV61_10760 [Candidatus Bathyarchaeota archaeon]|nr:hypothetical protein [Candidatus Bathyarchaeota archaeon]
MYKKSLTGLNILIFISLLILPGLLYISANNVANVAASIKTTAPTQTLNNNKLTISTTLTITNPGPFTVEASFTPKIEGNQGTQIGITGQKIQIPADTQQHNIPVSLEIDLSKISDEDINRLANNPENFTISLSASTALQPIISIGAEATAHLNWLPPIHNYTIRTPTITEVTPTQITIQVPLSFENQSTFLTVDGEEKIKIFDPTNQQVGEGNLKITAEPTTKWSTPATITLTPTNNIEDLLLKDTTTQYRIESDFTLTNYPITSTRTQTFTLEWGALIKNPQTQTSATPLNATHTKIMAQLSFLNNNHYITLDGTINPKIVNQTGESWAAKSQQIHVPPGTNTSLNFEFVIPNNQLISGLLKLMLDIQTQLGSTELEVTTLG